MDQHRPADAAQSESVGEHEWGELLPIYLNDHLAGAIAGSSRSRRTARAEANTADGAEFAEVATGIEADLETLRTIMKLLRVEPRRTRMALGWTAERLGLLKLNGRLFRRSPLSTLVEIEALRMGVEGKSMLWRSLRAHLRPQDLPGIDLDQLVERGTEQAAILTALHQRAAVNAFGSRAVHAVR